MAKHPVTGMDIEDGHGALPEHQQVVQHLHYIEQTQGEEAADAMRAELGLPPVKEEREAAVEATAAGTASAHELAKHDDRLTALEAGLAADSDHAHQIGKLSDRITELEAERDTHHERLTALEQGVSKPVPAPDWKPVNLTKEPETHGSGQ